MKKQYIFLIMIGIILYMLYLILSFSYKEYKINSHIEYIQDLNNDIKIKIKEADSIIDYKSSNAYRNKILKEQQSFKNKGEKVIYLTSESKIKKYTSKIEDLKKEEKKEEKKEFNIIEDLNIYEKWKYFLSGK